MPLIPRATFAQAAAPHAGPAAAVAAIVELGASADRTLDRVERTLDGIGKTPFPLAVAELRGRHLSAVRARSRQAIERARQAERTPDERRTAPLREATGHALAATLGAQVLVHAANVEVFGAFADQQGMSFGQLQQVHAEQFRRAIGLLDRCRETDPDRLAQLAVDASAQLADDAARLDQIIHAIDRGAVLSRRVVLALDLVFLAKALRSVAMLPVAAGRSGGTAVAGMSASGAAVAAPALGAGISATRMAEIVRTLVSVGALRSAAASVGATTLMMAGGGAASPPLRRPREAAGARAVRRRRRRRRGTPRGTRRSCART